MEDKFKLMEDELMRYYLEEAKSKLIKNIESIQFITEKQKQNIEIVNAIKPKIKDCSTCNGCFEK